MNPHGTMLQALLAASLRILTGSLAAAFRLLSTSGPMAGTVSAMLANGIFFPRLVGPLAALGHRCIPLH